ncbi:MULTISPECIES: macro domain-containing protein [Halomonas]|uniref:Appr-1-p processing protein n=2 Tax=Halomonas TaxID=2745 RepID=A0ABQ0U2Z5_9GAMM|nr:MULTISPECIES: macro domain-containing protein [Halomonas]PSJ21665.1 macro domain-containing protein [Halomonas sp. ND22Bw]KGE78470.1 Appr-1-p processing protein [Halomonas salina]MDR5888753.1 macro domain-containing protein [Halomonas salina]RAH38720.1 macro domain-containing protein [Halomonas sp. SL1]WJY07933.1 macro domain-containing protein [Halomonas halophila]
MHAHASRIECRQGDIARQDDIEAVVNAANARLMSGGGVAGALHRAAGPELAEACAPLAPIHPGEAVITDAFGLPNRHVIHCLGPVYGVDEPSDALLADCYRHALELAQRHDIESLAFPALSTGAFGYPAAEAARIALSTVLTTLPHCPAVRQVRFVLFDAAGAELHRHTLEALSAG